MSLAQIIEDPNIIPLIEQEFRADAANIPCAPDH
jgi:hypothetical protein